MDTCISANAVQPGWASFKGDRDTVMHARYHKVGEHVKQVCLAPDMELGRSGWYIK